MTTILSHRWPLLVALALAACQPLPRAAAPAPDAAIRFRAIGTEPFWDLTIGRDMLFTDRGNSVAVSVATPPVRAGKAHDEFRTPRLTVRIDSGPCSDGMSDQRYPRRVTVSAEGKTYRGCGARTGPDGRWLAGELVDLSGRGAP